MSAEPLYLGVMTGTSLDGFDTVLARFTAKGPEVLASAQRPFDPTLRAELLALCSPGENEIARLGVADKRLGEAIGDACLALLEANGVAPQQVRAIGSHGQTIRHHPHPPYPFTLQIGDPNHIAERTGIAVVSDFRRRDMAAGGQGAPLVPAFHRAVLPTQNDPQAVLNLGGIANVTLLGGRKQSVLGYDTGPGNTLLDSWIQRHRGEPFDAGGSWGASGTLQPELLEACLSDPYFSLPPPKSTGREKFNLSWLEQFNPTRWAPEDVQATLAALTVKSVARSLAAEAPEPPGRLWLAGGGRHNALLRQGLASALAAETEVCLIEEAGYDGDQLEALAFAWLAAAHCEGRAGNVPAVTGAEGERVLGGYYPP